MEPRFLLIVKAPAGLIIRDTPRPQSAGGNAMRTVPVGKVLYAYDIINIEGVPYARLVPQVPEKPEWARVREADGSVVYAEAQDLGVTIDPGQRALVEAINRLTEAINRQAGR